MKQEIFNKYVRDVCEIFSVSEDELFEKCKKKNVVDARHLLYYLCYRRPMKLKYIQDYMGERGYDISHHSVRHGIKCVQEKVKYDADYIYTVNKIKNEAII